MGALVKETLEHIKALEEHIEMAAAKIINDLTTKIEECRCTCPKDMLTQAKDK